MDKKTTLEAKVLEKNLLRKKTHGLQMDKVGEYSLINEIKNTFDIEERKGPGLKLSVQRTNAGSPKPPPSSVFSGVGGNSPKNLRKSRKSLFRSKTKGEEFIIGVKKPKKDFKRVKSILKRGRTFGQNSDVQSIQSSKKSSMFSRKVTFSNQTKGSKKYKKFRKSPYQESRNNGGGGHKSSMKRNLFVKLTNDIWN